MRLPLLRNLLARVVVKSRSITTTCLEVAGIGTIVYGFDRISLTYAVFAAGIGLILIGVLSA